MCCKVIEFEELPKHWSSIMTNTIKTKQIELSLKDLSSLERILLKSGGLQLRQDKV
jgi:hypothetical protein